jgi:tetratricopeptide (TPR) repeat protein
MDERRHRRLVDLVERLAAGAVVPEPGDSEGRELLGEARRLLACTDDFLEAPILGASAADRILDGLAAEANRAPEVSGLRLIRRIGRGAHADVWEAEELSPLARRVAVKVLARGGPAQRFELERLALARMAHPNVARVHAAPTTDDGRPCLVMELLRGLPLVAACEARNLDLRARVRVFIQVCEGVQHAHERGVIHRDLKPSNVLVVDDGGEAVPKVIDFGVAKALALGGLDRHVALGSGASATVVGQLVGTPNYMSPEQLGARAELADVRSDVYSLGAVLHELLVGVPPHDLGDVTLHEAAAIIADRPIPRPSSRNPAVRGDLEAIVQRALEMERSRRYPSASALAEDLDRWLRGEPVTARPPSTGRQLQWFIRRHRAAAAVAAGVTVGLLALGVAASWLYVAQRQENDRLRQRTQAMMQALSGLAEVAGSAESREQLSQLIIGELDHVSNEGDAELSGLLADALIRQSDVHRERGQMDAALAYRERALVAAERAAALAPADHEARRRYAKAQVLIGDVAKERGDPVSAEAIYRTAHQIYAELAALHPGEARFQLPLLWSHDRLLDLAASAGRGEEVSRHAAAMLAIAEALVAVDPAASSLQGLVAAREHMLGEWQVAGGDEALLRLRRANIRDTARLLELAPDNRLYECLYAHALTGAARDLGRLGRPAEGLPLVDRAIQRLRTLVERQPEHLESCTRLGEALSVRVPILVHLGRNDEARADAEAAVAWTLRARESQPENPWHIAAHQRALEQLRTLPP